MSYQVNNTHHKIIINLTTNTLATNTLKLRTYVNGNTTVSHIYDLSNGKFTIPMTDYNVGDVITKFELAQTGVTRLWKTHEGVQIYVNGLEQSNIILTDNVDYATFPITFNEGGEFDVQAVYVGNGSNKACRSNKLHIAITEPVPIPDSSAPVPETGNYILKFRDKTTPSTLKYNDGTKIYFQLLKGSKATGYVPVPNRVVQRVMGGHGIGSLVTDKNGCVFFENSDMRAGQWKLGAFYYDEINQKQINSEYRTITIQKQVPTIKDKFVKDKNGNDTNFIKGSKYVATFTYKNKKNKDTPLAKTKIDLYVNGKKSTLTTSEDGSIAYAFKTKDTFKLKVVFKGSDDLGKAEIERTITITE